MLAALFFKFSNVNGDVCRAPDLPAALIVSIVCRVMRKTVFINHMPSINDNTELSLG